MNPGIFSIRSVPSANIASWLETHIRPFLAPDVSSYAPGRLRCWLGTEPSLSRPVKEKPAVPFPDDSHELLEDTLGFYFTYCLVTYSGDTLPAAGIHWHQDAPAFAPLAHGWNVTGTATFLYHSPSSVNAESHMLVAGDLVRFDCKQRHAAWPSPRRWNLNFWTRAT